jgi:hypothetical protein
MISSTGGRAMLVLVAMQSTHTLALEIAAMTSGLSVGHSV